MKIILITFIVSNSFHVKDMAIVTDAELRSRNSYQFQVSKKLSEIKETLSTSNSGGAHSLKLKHFHILNENRQIDPVDISINLCDLEL